MSEEERPIRLLAEDSSDWARAHPGYFFEMARPRVQELRDQLLLGARTLSQGMVSEHSVNGWCIVASTDDWFSRGAATQANQALFHKLQAFPELGQNCSRPEFVVYTFARDVVTRGPDGTSVVKGSVVQAESAEIWAAIQSDAWQRIVAFRELDTSGRDAASS